MREFPTSIYVLPQRDTALRAKVGKTSWLAVVRAERKLRAQLAADERKREHERMKDEMMMTYLRLSNEAAAGLRYAMANSADEYGRPKDLRKLSQQTEQ